MSEVNTKMKTLESGIRADFQERCKALDDKIITVENKMSEMHTAPARDQTDESSESGEVEEEENEQDRRVNDRTKLIMCMDSNSKYLDPRKLWDLDGTEHKRCYTLSQVSQIVSRNIEYSNLKYFLISVGCNDLDNKEPEEVFNAIREIAVQLKTSYPEIKIIIGEITPRMDARDPAVIETNNMINEFSRDLEHIFVIKNSNLRDKKFFYQGDAKHIRKYCIGRFAANIKHTLRVAYGRKKFVQSYQLDNSERFGRHEQGGFYRQHQQQEQQHQHFGNQQLQQQLQQRQQLIYYLLQQQLSTQNSPNLTQQSEVSQRNSDASVLDVFNGLVT